MPKLATFFSVALAMCAICLAAETVTPEHWLEGMTRDEVVDLLGQPSKTKHRGGKTTLIYKFPAVGITIFDNLAAVNGNPQRTPFDPGETPSPGPYVKGAAIMSGDGLGLRRIEVRFDAEGRVECVKIRRSKQASK